ncbi:MAG: FAD-binding oxidoreductase [bacterium]|nr:FAD-binding oxidoreductase [bacterium]
MRHEARVVVIGGGVAGCSLLYHLTRLGWTDVLLIEKDELTSGSTWHAASLCTQVSPSYNLMKLLQYSLDLYGSLEAETGQAVDLHRCGSLRLANSQERLDEYAHRKGIADTLGVPWTRRARPARIRSTPSVPASGRSPLRRWCRPCCMCAWLQGVAASPASEHLTNDRIVVQAGDD